VRESSELNNFTPDDITHGFLVVPHDIPVDLTTLPGSAEKLLLVTNWWVERCLHGKSLVDPTEHVLCRPFDKFQIDGTCHPMC
jgi:DNA replication regulator DPB11